MSKHLNAGFYDKKNDRYVYIIRDNDTGVKQRFVVDAPSIPIYLIDESKMSIPDYYREYIPIDKAKKYYVKEKFRTSNIAGVLGVSDYHSNVYTEKILPYSYIYLDKRLFGADNRIEDIKLTEIMEKIGKDNYSVPTNPIASYIDIETDILVSEHQRLQPIYCIGSKSNRLTTNTNYNSFMINPKYKNQEMLLKEPEKFAERVKKNLIMEMNESKKIQKFGKELKKSLYDMVENMKFDLRGFHTEREVIIDGWQTQMNKERPDYLIAFNDDYDMGHTYLRAQELNIPLHEIFCVPELNDPYVEIVCDTVRKLNGRPSVMESADKFHPKNAQNWYNFGNYTKILDAMVLHYGLDPGGTDASFSLESTSNRLLGIGKFNFRFIAPDLFTLPYKDFSVAIEYNIRDNVLLEMIEMVSQDLKTNLIKRLTTYTEFDKLHKSSPYVTSAVEVRAALLEGVILCNNINRVLSSMTLHQVQLMNDPKLVEMWRIIKTERKISGGHVANPNQFTKVSQSLINGILNRVRHGRTIDMDFKAHYPTTMNDRNIGKETLIGKVTMIVKEGKKHFNPMQISQKLINRCIIGLGELFNLPSLHTLIEHHYKLRTNYSEVIETSDFKAIVNKDADSFRKILDNLVKIKRNDNDDDTGDFKISGTFIIAPSIAHMVMSNSLLEYTLHDDEGKIVNMGDILFGKRIDRSMYGTFFKEGEQHVFVENEDIDRFRHVTPKRIFSDVDMEHIDKVVVTNELIEMIKQAKFVNCTLGLLNDLVSVDINNRSIAVPLNNQLRMDVYKHKVETETGFFNRFCIKYSNSTNIVINKKSYEFRINQYDMIL